MGREPSLPPHATNSALAAIQIRYFMVLSLRADQTALVHPNAIDSVSG
jgi:hypothetical protein